MPPPRLPTPRPRSRPSARWPPSRSTRSGATRSRRSGWCHLAPDELPGIYLDGSEWPLPRICSDEPPYPEPPRIPSDDPPDNEGLPYDEEP